MMYIYLLLFIFFPLYSKSIDVDQQFDRYMGKNDPFFGRWYIAQMNNPAQAKKMEFYRTIYRNAIKAPTQPKTLIPKIIHQIWLGSPLPERFAKNQARWLELHPGWQYKLWTDQDVAQFGLQNQQLFDKATNWAEKADILRYEILLRMGGLYADVDMEPLKPFDELHTRFDFYAGIEPADMRYLAISNAIIGAAPDHPVMRHVVDSLPQNAHRNRIIYRTGPLHFTQAIFEVPLPRTSIILPSSYFFPLSWKNKKLKPKLESMAVHYWAGSWH